MKIKVLVKNSFLPPEIKVPEAMLVWEWRGWKGRDFRGGVTLDSNLTRTGLEQRT